MLFDASSYREYLKAVLTARKEARKAYSLRAFARDLGISSSLLSDVLLKKGNFSAATLENIAVRLRLNESEAEFFLLLGKLEVEKTKKGRAQIQAQLGSLRRSRTPPRAVEDSIYEQIADWIHSALLEVVSLDRFDGTAAGAARLLGLREDAVAEALRKLEKLKLLVRDGAKGWRRPAPALSFRPGLHTAALNRFYVHMLRKLEQVMRDAGPAHKRWSGYETMAVSRSAYPEIERACRRFMDEIAAITEAHPQKDHVAHLLVHFFELTAEEVTADKTSES